MRTTPCDMIGLIKTGRRKTREYVPATDFTGPRRGERYVRGLLLTAGTVARPVREMFPTGAEGDAQYEAHLDALSDRLMAGYRPDRRHRQAAVHQSPNPLFSAGGVKRRFDSLRVLNCPCGRVLLGPSDEPLRKLAHPTARKRFPPPVAGRIGDRMACAQCLSARAKSA